MHEPTHRFARLAPLFATLALVAGGALAEGDVNFQPDPLEPGRHPMIPHDHSEETTAKLKANIPAMAPLPDNVLHMIMGMMRADYAWYLSPADKTGKVGVLMLNHGVSEPSDQALRKGIAPRALERPTAIAFGMAMTTSQALQQAVDDLNARGVETIVAVDPESSEHKSIYRQWQYILGLRDKAAYVDVPQVTSKARILMVPPVNDSPIVAKILLDNARELSRNEKREAVVIIAHGPEDDVDNPPDLAEVRKLAAWVKKKSRFAQVDALNIQDDAPPPVRAANVKAFRQLVIDARARGQDVIVVPYVINAVGLQPKLQKDLQGLEFRFQEKGIGEHPNFLKWIDESVESTLRKARS
jgi:sirohydrochlorin ferrochelatase